MRRNWLDGVVISGGEPTLQNDIPRFCDKNQILGFPVKLDTNGSHPEVLNRMISEGLLDYIAMDIKTAPDRYEPVIAEKFDSDNILESIRLIMGSPVPYEFKTTCVKPLINESIMEIITGLISGARRYAIQRFHGKDILKPEFFETGDTVISEEEFKNFAALARGRVKECIVRKNRLMV